MRVAIRAAAVIIIAASSFAVMADDFIPNHEPTLRIERAPGEIKIDGRLDDAGWQGAAIADHFCENDPGENIKPLVETEAMLTYDDDHLYVAIIAYGDPGEVRVSLSERDKIQGHDKVGIYIDTYGDASWAYYLLANAYGTQNDVLYTSGYGGDPGYDLIWESKGQITDVGFQVEMAIPFSSLRFPNKKQHTWRIQLWRYYEREVKRTMSWASYDRGDPCFLCQYGKLVGLENVRPGRGIEIVSAYTASQAGAFTRVPRMTIGLSDSSISEFPDSINFVNNDPTGELSFNGKYSISSNATGEVTVNPDFSQVEADADQIDVNSTTALSFPEKRPFFQEGSDLFRTLDDVVYTRSINDPIIAAKGTARMGRTSLAFLGAYDEHSPVIIPFEEFSSNIINIGKSVSSIFRLRQSIGDGSRIGFLATNRHYDHGGTGSALSLDGYFRFSKSLNLNWQTILSYTDEPDDTVLTSGLYRYEFEDDTPIVTPATDFLFDDDHSAAFDGESFWGHGYIGLLDYSTRNTLVSARYSETSPTFRLDSGYEPNNDRREASLRSSYTFRFDDGLFKTIMPEIFSARIWNTGGMIKEERVRLKAAIALRWNVTYIHPSYEWKSEYYAGKHFDNLWTAHQCFSTTPSEQLVFGGGINYGHRIARRFRVVGKEIQTWFNLDLKPSDRLLVESQYNYIQSKHVDTDGVLYKGYIVRSRLNYQFNRELSLRFVVQYNDFVETWDFDPIITYRINPFTMFYVGTTYDYEKMYGMNEQGSAYVAQDEPGHNATRLSSRQFFMKLQYLFQL